MFADLTYDPAWIPNRQYVGRQILRDDASGADHRIVADGDARQYDRACASIISSSPGRYSSPVCILSFIVLMQILSFCIVMCVYKSTLYSGRFLHIPYIFRMILVIESPL